MRTWLLLVLLLTAPAALAQQPPLADPMTPVRRALALARTDSARGRLFGALAGLSGINDSIRYFGLQAITHLERALPPTHGADRRLLLTTLGTAYYNVGSAYANSYDWHRGMRYFRQSLRLHARSGDVPGQVATLATMGDEYIAQRNFSAALQCLKQGLKLGEQVPAAQISVVYCLINLGVLHQRLGNDSTALRFQLQALTMLERMAGTQKLDFKLAEMLGISTYHLADIYLEAYDDTARADYFARRAEQMGRLSTGYVRVSALSLRGKVLLRERRWPAARAALLTAQTEAIRNDDIPRRARIQNDLALVEENTGHLALALRYAQQAAAAGQLNQPANKSNSAEILARLYEKLGRPREALTALRHFVVLHDSISNEAAKRKVLGQALRADAERRTAQLRTEQAVAAANLHRQRQLLWGLLVGVGLLGLLAGQQWRNRRRQQQANARLAVQKAQIEEQAARLGELDAAKNQFFANVSHELRTPLTLVLGPLHDLLTAPPHPLPTAVRQPVALAYDHAQRLREQVNRILDLTKLQAGRLTLHPTPTALAPLLRRVVGQFASLAEQRGIALNGPATLPKTLRLRLDADKVEHILTNLLINALNHTPAGGSVTVDAQLPGPGGQYALTVRDTGPGVAPTEQERIFERYYQSPQRQAQGGTGLGLALSRELAALLGGSLTLVSEPGQGAAFTLRFPAPALPAEAESSAEEATAAALLAEEEVAPTSVPAEPVPDKAYLIDEAAPLAGPRPRVLVVEDQPDLREYLRQLLAPAYEVHTAPDGQAALDLLAREVPFDLIMTDAMMPRLSGIELLACLRANPIQAAVPVLMLTARADEAHRLTALTVGVDDYLTKPFVAAELRTRVRALLVRQQVRRQFAAQPPEPETTLPAAPLVTELRRDEAAPMAVAAPVIAEAAAQLIRWQALATEHLANEQFGPAELADLLCLSERTLYRRLGELAGLSPAAWLRELRLDQARRRLEAGGFGSVAAVAEAAGFSNVKYFATLYAERFGRRPASYRP